MSEIRSRLDLQSELEELIGRREDKKQNVYFQPPKSLKMVYPCIVYSESDIDVIHADNSKYTTHGEYQLTIIEQNPDSDLAKRLLDRFDHIRYQRTFTNSNLYHRVFNLYY